MKKLVAAFLIGVFILCLAGTAMAGSKTIVLVNESGKTIKELYMSPNNTDDWQNNILKGDPLKTDYEQEIELSWDDGVDKWDFKIVDSSGKSWVWRDKKIAGIKTMTYSYKNGKGWLTYNK